MRKIAKVTALWSAVGVGIPAIVRRTAIDVDLVLVSTSRVLLHPFGTHFRALMKYISMRLTRCIPYALDRACFAGLFNMLKRWVRSNDRIQLALYTGLYAFKETILCFIGLVTHRSSLARHLLCDAPSQCDIWERTRAKSPPMMGDNFLATLLLPPKLPH